MSNMSGREEDLMAITLWGKEGMDGGHGGKKPSRAVLGGSESKEEMFSNMCEGRKANTGGGGMNECFIARGSSMVGGCNSIVRTMLPSSSFGIFNKNRMSLSRSFSELFAIRDTAVTG